MGWTATERVDLELGAKISSFLARPQDHIQRIVETISFVGVRRVRRSISVEFDLNADLQVTDPETDQKLALVPLLLLKKGALVAFEARDENGTIVPILTSKECGFVAWCALVAAGEIAKGPLEAAFITQLGNLVWHSPKQAQEVADNLSDPASEYNNLWEQLQDQVFGKLARDFIANDLVVVPLSDTTPRRRVLTISFDEPVERLFRPQRAVVRLGWRPTRLLFDVPSVASCRSYHIELEAPPGLEIFGAMLRATRGEDSPRVATELKATPRIHLNLEHVPQGSRGQLTVGLRATREGLLSAAAASGVFAALVLVLCWRYQGHIIGIRENADAAVALLLAVPALIAAYIARPEEHVVAARLLVGVRLLTLTCGLLLYVAAAVIVIGLQGKALRITAASLAALGVVCAGALVWSLAVSRHQKAPPMDESAQTEDT